MVSIRAFSEAANFDEEKLNGRFEFWIREKFLFSLGPPKKMDFFSPQASQRYVFSLQRLFEF